MTTRLVPGHKPSFRKLQFKPTLFTNEWQRPSDGDPTRPGEYGKPAESVHLKSGTDHLPQVRGRCSSSVAAPSDRTVALSARDSSARSRSPGKKQPENDKLALTPSAKLIKQSELFKAQADAELYRSQHMFDEDPFKKIGVAMNKVLGSKTTDKDMLDLMTQWDANANSKLHIGDFRTGILNEPPFGFGVNCDQTDLDKVFQTLDKEGNGYLEPEKITGTFVKLHEKSKVQVAEQEAVIALAERLRVRGQKAFDVAQVTMVAEAADAELEEARRVDTVDAQLGRLLIKRKLMITDILLKWDKDKNGTINKTEFRVHVRHLGVEAEDEAIDVCFDKYDVDGGGSLDIPELKPTLKKCAQAAQEAEDALAKFVKQVGVKKKHAKRTQVQYAQEQTTEQKNALEVARRRDEKESKQREEAAAAKAISDAKAAEKAAAAAEKSAHDAEVRAAKEAAKEEAYERLMGGGAPAPPPSHRASAAAPTATPDVSAQATEAASSTDEVLAPRMADVSKEGEDDI